MLSILQIMLYNTLIAGGFDMEHYEKKGYLSSDFRLFHLTDRSIPNIKYHYHEFDKITILIKGNVHYTIEGRTLRYGSCPP